MQEATNLEHDLAEYLNQRKTHRKYMANNVIKQSSHKHVCALTMLKTSFFIGKICFITLFAIYLRCVFH